MAMMYGMDLIALARGVIVSEFIFRYVMDRVEKKLGDKFRNLGFATLRKIAKKSKLKFRQGNFWEPIFELMFFKIEYKEGYAIADFFLISRNLEDGGNGKYKNFYVLLKKELGLGDEVIEIKYDNLCVRETLAGKYFPVMSEPCQDMKNAQKVFKAISELDSSYGIIR